MRAIPLLIILAFAMTCTFATETQFIDSQMAKPWAEVFKNLAELQMMTNGPIEDLVSAIKNLQEDLVNKQQTTEDDFTKRTGQHKNDVKKFQGEITDANLDITNSDNLINNVLLFQKADLEKSIDNLNRGIADDEKFIENSTKERELSRSKHQERVQEHQNAIDAINECVGIIVNIDENGQVASLAQVSEVHERLEKIENKLPESIEGTLIKTLLSIKSEKFADSQAIKKVRDLLVEIGKQLQDSLDKENRDDATDEDNFQKDLKAKQAEINQYTMDNTEHKKDLGRTVEQIEVEQKFEDSRKQDLIGWQRDLDQENAAFDADTKYHEDLVQEFAKELEACDEAVELLQSGQFASSINDRLNGVQGAGLSKQTVSVN